MNNIINLHPTRCAICNTEDNAIELYPANFNQQAFNPAIFSARRLPDLIHYRIVKCNTCSLVRSDPIAEPAALARLYSQSNSDCNDEVVNLKLTYGRYLAKLAGYGARKGALLEIGCGNGFFLEEALREGYAIARGVEPSSAAVEKANPQVRPHIICDIMRPGLFKEEQFDIICMFQLLDHIPDPGALLAECFRLLRPGGIIFCLNHNIESASAIFLKRRNPIIDIEHTYLYSPKTLSQLFVKHGFKVRGLGSVLNKCSLYYLIHLIPLPFSLKRIILISLKKSHFGHISLSLPLGNLYLIVQKAENLFAKKS